MKATKTGEREREKKKFRFVILPRSFLSFFNICLNISGGDGALLLTVHRLVYKCWLPRRGVEENWAKVVSREPGSRTHNGVSLPTTIIIIIVIDNSKEP